LPLSALAIVLARPKDIPSPQEIGALTRAAVASAAASALALGAASFVGGFVIGKWADPRIGAGHAALAGLSAAMIAVTASWIALGFAPWALLAAVIAVPFAAAGGKAGATRKSKP
jgi:hypothetical protein